MAAVGMATPCRRHRHRLAWLPRAVERSGVRAEDLDFIETHGTGTSLGDPIEISGLMSAFAEAREQSPDKRWPISSVKSQIGHLEGAAGIAALSKVLLQLQHRALAPTLHAGTPNAHIEWADVPFDLVQQYTDLPAADQIDHALISSFGAGGSNAAMVVAGPIAPVARRHATMKVGTLYPVPLSARTEASLRANAAALLAALDEASFKTGEDTTAEVEHVLADVLGSDPSAISGDDDLRDLGLDAVLMQQVLQSWVSSGGRSVRLADVTGLRTISELARVLSSGGRRIG